MPSIKAQIKPLLHQIKVPAFNRREARTEERSPGLQAICRSRRKERTKETIQNPIAAVLVRQPFSTILNMRTSWNRSNSINDFSNTFSTVFLLKERWENQWQAGRLNTTKSNWKVLHRNFWALQLYNICFFSIRLNQVARSVGNLSVLSFTIWRSDSVQEAIQGKQDLKINVGLLPGQWYFWNKGQESACPVARLQWPDAGKSF